MGSLVTQVPYPVSMTLERKSGCTMPWQSKNRAYRFPDNRRGAALLGGLP